MPQARSATVTRSCWPIGSGGRIGHGRGYAVAIARSADGVHFETIQVITRDEMDTESLERPALVRTPSGDLAVVRQLRHVGD